MCTLIIAHRIFAGFPIVVAANRDELLDRPSETPRIRADNPNILAPKDLQRGGTWIGVNESGVFAGLTNRMDIKSKPGRTSRGKIIIDALRQNSSAAAIAAISEKMSGEELNGFNSIIADQNNAFLMRGDGEKITYSPITGLFVITNHGIGDEGTSDIPKRVTAILRIWKERGMIAREPVPKTLDPLLTIHDGWRHGTCINEPDENYGTKSSSIIRLTTRPDGDEWQYWHRERSSPNRHVCLETFAEPISLPIQSL